MASGGKKNKKKREKLWNIRGVFSRTKQHATPLPHPPPKKKKSHVSIIKP